MNEKTLLKSIHPSSTEIWITFILIAGIAVGFYLYIGKETVSTYLVGIFMGIIIGVLGTCNLIETKLKEAKKKNGED